MGMISEYSKILYDKQQEIEKKENLKKKVKNLKYHPENFSIDLSNARFVLKTKSVVGNVRKNNEDNSTVMISPFNSNVKLLAVADGLGGCEYGEEASKIAITDLNSWFLGQDFTNMSDSEIKKQIAFVIGLMNHNVNTEQKNRHAYSMGTTITMALITDNKTYIANVGDSRTYCLMNDKLIQITEDDSMVWEQYKHGMYKKEELRTAPGNNIIGKCIGNGSKLGNVTISMISNEYKGLLSFSDGITDVLSDKNIKDIINVSSKDLLAESLIAATLDKDNEEAIELNITPGKDNSTVAVYMKK